MINYKDAFRDRHESSCNCWKLQHSINPIPFIFLENTFQYSNKTKKRLIWLRHRVVLRNNIDISRLI